MIVLFQSLKYPPEGWEDMTVPPQPSAMPVRGVKPKVETPQKLADILAHAELPGQYRVVLDDGSVWRIGVDRVDRYETCVTRV